LPNRKTPRIQLPLKFGTQQDPQLFILDTGSPNGILWRKDIVGEPESLFSELIPSSFESERVGAKRWRVTVCGPQFAIRNSQLTRTKNVFGKI
jgi:hypothetical protein